MSNENPNYFVTTVSTVPAVGYQAVLISMEAMLQATQLYVNEATGMGTSILETEDGWATYYNDYMSGPITQKINADVAAGGQGEASAVQADTAQLSVVNSQLSQSNSFWGGLSQSIQQSGSNISSTLSVIYQMLQQGILSTLTTIAQSWKA